MSGVAERASAGTAPAKSMVLATTTTRRRAPARNGETMRRIPLSRGQLPTEGDSDPGVAVRCLHSAADS